jgi:hypothetical protein
LSARSDRLGKLLFLTFDRVLDQIPDYLLPLSLDGTRISQQRKTKRRHPTMA